MTIFNQNNYIHNKKIFNALFIYLHTICTVFTSINPAALINSNSPGVALLWVCCKYGYRFNNFNNISYFNGWIYIIVFKFKSSFKEKLNAIYWIIIGPVVFILFSSWRYMLIIDNDLKLPLLQCLCECGVNMVAANTVLRRYKCN